VVPEYLLSSLKKRKTGNNSALSILTRNKDSKNTPTTEIYRMLALYVTNRLDGMDRDIGVHPDAPFSKKVGMDPDVFKFMEYLGWTFDDQQAMFHAPQWDEEVERGRLRRKLLEGAEIELSQLVLDGIKEGEKVDKRIHIL
jgi:hypothetical protein